MIESDLLSPDTFQEERHHPIFREWRESDPVHWHEGSSGSGFWCLTKHDDVQWASRDPDNFISSSGFTLMDIEQGDLQSSAMSQMLPGMDRPEHTRFRRIVSKGFSPRTIRLVEEHLALKARLIVDSVLDRRSCDFVVDVVRSCHCRRSPNWRAWQKRTGA